MKKVTVTIFLFGILISCFMFLSGFSPSELTGEISKKSIPTDPGNELKQQAFEILKTKCNVCHRKQNPFKIFSLRNMNKHAPKIKEQVFIKKRMPKGDKIRLTAEEYQTLKNWLGTL